MSDARAIGVFDSGVGGLTVLSALWRALPNESTVYLGDTARVPYGTRSASTVVKYAVNNAHTLAKAAPLKMLVVACNTVSAVALPALAAEMPIPVVGVIVPGASAAVQACQTAKRPNAPVVIFGTSGTIRSGAYPQALAALGHTGSVHLQACPLLVPLVEEGFTDGDLPRLALQHYLAGIPMDAGAAVLGCTHYPLLRPIFRKLLPESIAVVDGAEVTAQEAARLLDLHDLRRQQINTEPKHRVLVSDAPEQMAQLAPRFLGEALRSDGVELVDVEVKS